MGDFDVERVLVDTGSTVNVICWQTLEKMGVTLEQLKPESRTLTGYDGVTKLSMGDVKLQVRAGGLSRKTKFEVIDSPSVYNAILGYRGYTRCRPYHRPITSASSSQPPQEFAHFMVTRG
ncbi:PREDICTED: uncharacterized protein LOC104768197 [Camelina sativa]|uniref:Uncharacterized protein LOC104768197 n=1 Tax=Camelina sativa TaxID=90675 RepID=A0ABM0XSL3_CAMSA|nr:PREDICTED: uncharacterized protein LOC104768197 [Camelina sativa]